MRQLSARDRVGLGWRPELAAGILTALDRIDLVEVIAENHLDASARDHRALRTLARQVPVTIHGVSLGLASAAPVTEARLERLARLITAIEPESWSEHLSFVRGGGIEIGHLAAPPRTEATVAGAIRNLQRARTVIGQSPLVENVATLIDPPGSAMPEPEWVAAILAGSGCDLLLDLHNLYANAVNFNWDPLRLLDAVPPQRIRTVHLAGGRWIPTPDGQDRRLLDDHLHDVPDVVFDLLEEVAARVPTPLTVIVERDGRYPPMASLLTEVDRARQALQAGRRRATLVAP